MFWESTFDSYGLAIVKGGEAAYRIFNGKELKEVWEIFARKNSAMADEATKEQMLVGMAEAALTECRKELIAEITKPSMKERFEAMLAERGIPLE